MPAPLMSPLSSPVKNPDSDPDPCTSVPAVSETVTSSNTPPNVASLLISTPSADAFQFWPVLSNERLTSASTVWLSKP